jgi:NAD(P)-dependent dehydrogenase (short-subunit alcohol dehydrogenase family)
MGRLSDKAIVVAGAATGMGAETARRLASEGARVVVGDLDMHGAERVAADIARMGGEAIPVRFDLNSEASVAALMDRAVAEFGRIDGLHANAADLSDETVHGDRDAVSIEIELFDSILRSDLRGYLFCCRHAIPRMLERGSGAIVCTASDGALMPQPYRVAYCAAKAGVVSLVRHVAIRWGKDGIRCNAVSPGLIQSKTALRSLTPEFRASVLDRLPSTRLGEVADIAGSVAYLLSDDASWVNGQILSVNGGGLSR